MQISRQKYIYWSVILVMRPEILFLHERIDIWNMLSMYIEKQITLFYFVHDENFKIRPKWT